MTLCPSTSRSPRIAEGGRAGLTNNEIHDNLTYSLGCPTEPEPAQVVGSDRGFGVLAGYPCKRGGKGPGYARLRRFVVNEDCAGGVCE